MCGYLTFSSVAIRLDQIHYVIFGRPHCMVEINLLKTQMHDSFLRNGNVQPCG